jgi:PucR family transcriptional regulator, purine catabolism regulatory protein
MYDRASGSDDPRTDPDPQPAHTAYAGRSGERREVLSAGACQLPDPTERLGQDDLLMTIGLAVPRGAEAQTQWIGILANPGLSGVALGESGAAPGSAER